MTARDLMSDATLHPTHANRRAVSSPVKLGSGHGYSKLTGNYEFECGSGPGRPTVEVVDGAYPVPARLGASRTRLSHKRSRVPARTRGIRVAQSEE